MEFLSYVAGVLTPINIAIIAISVVIGIVLGALPGISSAVAVALVLPVTFTMEPATALIFLGSIYMASCYGGSYGAILLNAPGTPQSIATTFDGFPMTRRGEGALAMYLSCLVSVVGGLTGIICFVLLAPPLSKIALMFGPSELFWLGIFGVSIMSTLSGEGGPLKGLISGVLGLALSLVGIAVISSDTRYTLGMPGLVGGIGIVPACIGLLVIPVVIDMMRTKDEYIQMPVSRQRKVRFLEDAMPVLRSNRLNLLRSNIIGLFVGVVPAAGGAIASLLAYSAAMRSSGDPASYGKGNPGGVIASETANNATVASSFVPTFVLAVPGTPADAVILAAMLIHGLQVGPALFTHHADILWTFMLGLSLATALILPIGLFMGRHAYQFIVAVPKSYLAPLIATTALVGSFSYQNSHFDMVIALVLGGFGWLIARCGFSAPPMVLGLLLGPIIERSFTQAFLIGRATNDQIGIFLGRPISIVIIICVLISVFAPHIMSNITKRRGARHVS
ncbi:MAG: tripartite tricarboxylate transporter permease [Parvibaculaceae bacterium]